MKRSYSLLLSLLITTVLFSQNNPQPAPINPEFEKYQNGLIQNGLNNMKSQTANENSLGLIPSPVLPNFAKTQIAQKILKATTFVSKYDLRTAGPGGTSLLTSVKDQNPCGACWAFAAMGAIEGYAKKTGMGEFDLSENNLKECHGFALDPCAGGNIGMTTAYLARKSGPVSELNDPYYASVVGCKDNLYPEFWISDMRYLPNDANTIKQAIIDYGALSTNMFWDDASYIYTNYTYYYSGTTTTNHEVLLVGWDDNKITAGGIGAWIIKNSWGDSWGENGFFYISYNDTKVNSVIASFRNINTVVTNSTQFGYDQLGTTGSWGYSSNVGYGLIRFSPGNKNYTLKKLSTFLPSGPATVRFEVYDDFNGTTLSNLMGTNTDKSCDLPGYYTFDLATPIQVSANNDFYIKVYYNTVGFNYPIPVEMFRSGYANPEIESGKCWMSSNGTSWSAIGSNTSTNVDLCIKAYGEYVPCTPPTSQTTTFISSALANNSMTIGWTRGNGNAVLVVARAGSAVSVDPYNETAYTANAAFGSGTQIGTGNYVVYNGTGASVNLTALTPGSTYYFSIYEYNSASNCYLTPALTGNVKTTGTAVTDLDGNFYNIVTIGTQTWMVENLKTTKYNDGTSIPLVTTAWSYLTTPGYCWYNNDDGTYKNKYGALYNWYAVNTSKLAPTGWHIPTDAEWTTLESYVNANLGTSGTVAKALAATTDWYPYTDVSTIGSDLSKNNSSGFAAFPGGYRDSYLPTGGTGPFGFNNFTYNGRWWSSNERSTGNAWYRSLSYNMNNVGRNYLNEQYGLSVRCIKDVLPKTEFYFDLTTIGGTKVMDWASVASENAKLLTDRWLTLTAIASGTSGKCGTAVNTFDIKTGSSRSISFFLAKCDNMIITANIALTRGLIVTINDGANIQLDGTGACEDYVVPVNSEAPVKITVMGSTSSSAWTSFFTFSYAPKTPTISAFKINSTLAVIDQTAKTITLQMPWGTNISAVTPAVTISWATGFTPTGAQDFTTGPITYAVTDGTTTNNYSAYITVKQANKVPIANAGIDQIVNEGSTVTLDGSASSDADNDPLTYKWTAPSGITLSSTTTSKPTFTAPQFTKDTTYTFNLVVNDGTVDSPADQVDITVNYLSQQDSLALVALFKATDGTNWTRKNNWLTGPIDSWEGVTIEDGRVVGLNLDGAGLNGALPAELSDLTSIRNLNLSSNKLSGLLPENWSALVNLQNLDLRVNQLSGNLPESWSTLVNLQSLYLHFNQLSGNLPGSWSALLKLQDLRLYVNQLSGVLPDSWSSLVNLTVLDIAENQITGIFPESWRALVNLRYLNLSKNEISDLPNLSKLIILSTLVIQNNLLDFGDIEPNIGVPQNYFYYSPQAPIGIADTIIKKQGEEFSISVSVGGNSNKYQWYKNGVSIFGATGTEYVIPSVSSVDAGDYTCQITNTVATDLTLQSQPITLQISNQSYTHNIPLIAGWNIISSNVVPSITNLKDIVQPLIDDGKLNKVMDESGKVIEDFGAFGGWQNGIGTFSQTEGYKVNMMGTDALVLQGKAVKLPFSISLSAGWNITPYPCANAQSALTMVQSLIALHTLEKVMDESGKVIEDFGVYGGWKNNIGDFIPGKGYKIKVNQSCIHTIFSSELRSATKVPTVLPSAYFTKAFSGNGTDHMNIHLVDLAASALQVGDEIGIFDGKVCVGSAAIGEDQMSEGSISIPASSNDELGGTVNGYTSGHPVELMLYRDGETFDLSLEKLRGSVTFEKDGSLFAKVASKQPTTVSNTDGSIMFFCHPNPFAEEIQIDVRNMESTKISVDIYNLFGQKIKMLYDGANTGLLNLKWNGTNDKGNRIVAGVYLCRVNDQSKKIVFIGGK